MTPDQALQAARESFRRDLARLSFDGYIVTGPAKLVSIDIAKAKMMVRRRSLDKNPYCYINLPIKIGPECVEGLSRALVHPKLRGCGPDVLDDMISTLWAYINLRLLEHPVSIDSFALSMEAADTLQTMFPDLI
jgi:hypothetical protein